jgi:hypothetical protein
MAMASVLSSESSTRRSSGLTGSTIAGFSSFSATFPRSRLRTIAVRRAPPGWRNSSNPVSGKPGAYRPAASPRPGALTRTAGHPEGLAPRPGEGDNAGMPADPAAFLAAWHATADG